MRNQREALARECPATTRVGSCKPLPMREDIDFGALSDNDNLGHTLTPREGLEALGFRVNITNPRLGRRVLPVRNGVIPAARLEVFVTVEIGPVTECTKVRAMAVNLQRRITRYCAEVLDRETILASLSLEKDCNLSPRQRAWCRKAERVRNAVQWPSGMRWVDDPLRDELRAERERSEEGDEP